MPLVSLLVALIVLVLVLYVIREFLPGDARLRNLVMGVAVILFILWVFGLL